MNKRIFLCLILGISGMMFALLIPDTSLAQFEVDNPLDTDDFVIIVERLIDLVFKIAIVVAPLMIGIGALLFTTAGGNAERVNQAKKIILWTIIGFVVVLLAQGIIQIVEDLFLGTTSTPAAAPPPPPPPPPPVPDPCEDDPNCVCLLGDAGIGGTGFVSCQAAYGPHYPNHDPNKTTCNSHRAGVPQPDRCCCQ